MVVSSGGDAFSSFETLRPREPNVGDDLRQVRTDARLED